MDSDLVQRSRQGDLEAFNLLVEKYQVATYNLCFRLLGDAGAAEDATQEAFVTAFQKIGQLRGENFRAWLWRIAANKCTDYLRHTRSGAVSLEAAGLDFPASREGPEAAALRKDAQEIIQEGLNQLPADQRLVVVMVDVQGLSYEEVAQALKTSPGTVRSRLHRGRQRLRDFLRGRELLP